MTLGTFLKGQMMTKIDNKIWREIKKEIKYDALDIHNDSPFVSKSGAGKKVLSKYRVTVPSFHTDFIVAENEEEALNKFLDSVGGVNEAEYVEYDFDENDPSLDAIWFLIKCMYRITVIEVTWKDMKKIQLKTIQAITLKA